MKCDYVKAPHHELHGEYPIQPILVGLLLVADHSLLFTCYKSASFQCIREFFQNTGKHFIKNSIFLVQLCGNIFDLSTCSERNVNHEHEIFNSNKVYTPTKSRKRITIFVHSHNSLASFSLFITRTLIYTASFHVTCCKHLVRNYPSFSYYSFRIHSILVAKISIWKIHWLLVKKFTRYSQ